MISTLIKLLRQQVILLAVYSVSNAVAQSQVHSFNELPALLSNTNLYTNIITKEVVPENHLFSPQYPLWSDGAKKVRWIFLPENTQINTDNQNRWVFPLGTTFWKEFSQNGKRVETRILKKVRPQTSLDAWLLGSYVWNSDETEATLAPNEGVIDAAPTPFANISHDIPSKANCLFCHNKGGDPVLGFDALQLSDLRDPLAPHREIITEQFLTLNKLALKKLITKPLVQSPTVSLEDPIARASVGYLHGNCGSCHNPDGSAGYTGWFTLYNLNANYQNAIPVIETGIMQLTQFFEVPGRVFGVDSFRIEPQNPDASALFYRMSHRSKDIQMPPVATKMQDYEAMNLIRNWINSM